MVDFAKAHPQSRIIVNTYDNRHEIQEIKGQYSVSGENAWGAAFVLEGGDLILNNKNCPGTMAIIANPVKSETILLFLLPEKSAVMPQ
jgi:hypothetical protein